MALDFPSSPSVNDTYAIGTPLRTWRWNGEGWERVINAGQVVSVLVAILTCEDTIAEFPASNDGAWTLLNYV